ncbi:hypothetical protein BBJ29_003976 [Phytophthora kernoviae]|uniref:Palmitoyltransferase n=1 Tax=Phytophthora kernoviae TaxID=325452 RepID=A0A421FHY9_9STRA|nr:hypothetical protein BBJ29_003976 [Phytophthora kernoviae]
MNVTRHNFAQCIKDLQKDLELPTCRFVAIDTEFTGLSPNEFEREQYLDTLEERYHKVKRAGESFLITQFGLSTVHLDQKDQFQIRTWNFYIFPRPYGSLDERFLCQASSMQFLSEHGFDFNKFIRDGIPFVNLSKTAGMKKRLQRRIDGLTKVNKNLTLSEDGKAFQDEVKEKLDQWIAGGAKKGEKLLVPTRNSFYSMVVHETVRAKASYLYSESTMGGVEVSYVSKKIKEELIAKKTNEMKCEMDEAIGFSKVIEALSASKKPVVGHNALLDFVYVFHQFYKPLPGTLAEFKTQVLELFPTIFDTKHVTLRSPLGDKLKSTSLSALFEYMRENVKPAPESLIPDEDRFDTYREALKAEADGNKSLLCHEAGFDAFMTAVCFLGLLAHDATGELPDQKKPKEGSSARLKLRLEELESFKNQLNLMISDESFLDLGNVSQTIDRARVYRVSSTTKRRIQHVRMEDVFKTSKVQRVVRESDQNAFVVLSEPAEAVNDETKAELGVEITSYDEHVASATEKSQLKEETDRKLFEQFKAARASDASRTSDAKEDASRRWGMSIESEGERSVRASASPAARKCEAKRVELQRLRDQLDKVRAGDEDEDEDEDALLLAIPHANTDPLSCFCKLLRVQETRILYERRVLAADGVNMETKLVLVGPHWIGVLVTLCIIVVSSGMFLVQQYPVMPWYYTAITFGLCGMTLYYLFLTTCTDPGIVRPSRQKDLALDETESSELESGQFQNGNGVEGDTQLLPTAQPLGRRRHPTARRRYCDICGIEQDRYTDHCEDCGVCVAGYDHHCPWMGKCIGKGNMYAFKMFNVSWVLYVVFVLFVSIMSIDWGHAAVMTLHRTASGSWVTIPHQD